MIISTQQLLKNIDVYEEDWGINPESELGEIFSQVRTALSEIREIDDAVSRTEVLKIVYEFKESGHEINYGTLLDINRLLYKLPATFRTPHEWHVVAEEGQPDSSGVYEVTILSGDECEDNLALTDACYYDGCGTWYNDNRINHSRDYVTDRVVAWKPLSEPWRGK